MESVAPFAFRISDFAFIPYPSTAMSLNSDLSNLFRTLAALMDLKGESAFKAIAFSKVSRILKDMTLDLEEYCRDGKLKDIEGIGPSSQRIIEQYVKTGQSEDYEEVAASVPAGLIPMLDIPSLGPKTIAMLWKRAENHVAGGTHGGDRSG